ncbi:MULTISPECIES: glycosyltransferase family 2 protein [Christiangramia]|uniref:Glycosyl transferase, family 2 n=1 Tax=Christiangramia flava JLT2011 TaxID=1229726 RepID=A0A1L7I786_9FLAO|nr:glycosyltransferase family 2 protein [Christiangramia flava]APU69084.1 Glycosyl transferase, family 2 [Christiangramia flava JLT2011]OSS38315.1 Glycosyl transferase, family 2 [Christiangramia flava JLT2011]
MFQKLSILIPAYNEAETVAEILVVLRDLKIDYNLQKEIIVVDDSSTDETFEIISDFRSANPELDLKIFSQEYNMGKGAAIHRAIKECSGDIAIVQDADLEYDPEEYSRLLKPIMKGQADVVYGSRFMGGFAHRILFFWHSIGNKFLTMLSNAFTNLNLTDMETCYKMFRTEILKSLDLKEKRFGFEPEVTAKISRIPGIRIYEVGISYYGRTYSEGKKINWKDGVHALWCIFKYNI